jgi:nitrous oxidase accessory protein
VGFNKTRTALVSTVILFFILSLNPPATVEAASIITVPTDYLTIQAAINAAAPGDTINILPKTYLENITITKSLTLIGADRENTIIDANKNGIAVDIFADDVTITNLTITNGKSPFNDTGAIYCRNVNNAKIISNIVTNNYGNRSIYIFNGLNNIFFDNMIKSNSGAGITLDSSSGLALNHLIANNTITDNGKNESMEGIALYGFSSKITIENNTFTNNLYGIASSGVTDLLIKNNKFNSNINTAINLFYTETYAPNDTYTGIKPTNAIIEGNLLTGNRAGCWIVGRNTTIRSNSILSNTQAGIWIDGENNTIANNLLDGNMQGISFKDLSNSTIASNQITNNQNGIFIQNSTLNSIYNNKFINNFYQITTKGTSLTNYFDNGSIGNFWSNILSTDIFNGTGGTLYGPDGIADQPYRIDSNNVDNYPIVTSANRVNDNFAYTTQGLTATFDASPQKPSSGNATYRWTFGDGQTITETTHTITHTYTSQGQYTVTLLATDSAGGTIQRAQNITVSSPVTITNSPGPGPSVPPSTGPSVEPGQPTNSTEPTPTPSPPASNSPSIISKIIEALTSRQGITVTGTVAGTIGVVSAVNIAATAIETFRSPSTKIEQTERDLAKKCAEKALENTATKKKSHKIIGDLSRQEIGVLALSITLMTVIVGVVKAGGPSSLLTPEVLPVYLFAAFISVFAIQTVTLLSDVSCSSVSGIKKRYFGWKLGAFIYSVSGLIVLLPFSAPAVTAYPQKFNSKSPYVLQAKGLRALTKILTVLSLLTFFGLLTLSQDATLSKIGDSGIFTLLISTTFSLLPIPRISGMDVFKYSKAASILLSAGMIVILVFYLIANVVPLWTYSIIGLFAALLATLTLIKLRNNRLYNAHLDESGEPITTYCID